MKRFQVWFQRLKLYLQNQNESDNFNNESEET